MSSLPSGNVRLSERLRAEWSQSLEEFGTLLGSVMNLAAFDYDAENVYEWGQALTKDGHLEINISRRHGYVPPASEHISVILMVSKDAPVEWNEQWVAEHLLPRYTAAIVSITELPDSPTMRCA